MRKRFLVIGIVLQFIFISIASSFAVDNINESPMSIFDGKILYTPLFSLDTYLINSNGVVVNTWHSNYLPALSAYMLPNGNILRPIRLNLEIGGGGGIEEYNPQGELVWSYEYYLKNNYQSHHDIEPLPNGNVLMLTWEYKNKTEVTNAGRNTTLMGGNSLIAFEHIIEVKPIGKNNGDIVWQWHSFDHLIQDYDSSKPNYGVVGDHPELIDLNYCLVDGDWLHCNSIDYNEEFDQILISCRNFNEVWIIDHNTTTAEASGHIGGRYGKGGDILYRWGNPKTYRIDAPQKLFQQHDATWIDKGCSGEGNILIFNNGIERKYSSVDEIVPPVNSSGFYEYIQGSSYAPIGPIWSYTNPSFYEFRFSGAQRLRSGTTLICGGVTGKFFMVTPEMETVWQYSTTNNIFKIAYVYPIEQNDSSLYCLGSLSFPSVKPEETVVGTFQVSNNGSSLLNWSIVSYPSWGNWSFTAINGSLLAGENAIVDVTILAPKEKQKYIGTVKVEDSDNSSNFCEIDVYLKTLKPRINKFTFCWLIQLLNKRMKLFDVIR